MLIEEKDIDKRVIKNWSAISLLNKNTKRISKLLAKGLKNICID